MSDLLIKDGNRYYYGTLRKLNIIQLILGIGKIAPRIDADLARLWLGGFGKNRYGKIGEGLKGMR